MQTTLLKTRAISHATKLAGLAVLLGSYACSADAAGDSPIAVVSQAILQPDVFLEQPGIGQKRVDQAGLAIQLWVDYDTDNIGFVKGWVTNYNDTQAWVGLYVGIKCSDAEDYEWQYWEEVVEPTDYTHDRTIDYGVLARFVFCPPDQRTAGAIYVESDAPEDED